MITEEKPDIQPIPVRNAPSQTLVTRLSQQVSDLEETVGRLRRRMALERGIAGAVILALGAAWGVGKLAPSAWALTVNGRPVVAMRSRAELESLVARVRQDANPSVQAALQEAEIRRADPGQIEVADSVAAPQRLAEGLELHGDRGVIYVDGKPVLALPDAAQGRAVLEQLKQSAAARLSRVEEPPAFKEQVEVRTEPAPRELWADAESAPARLAGQGGGGTHTVRSGESAWIIARREKMTLEELRKLNPGVDLERLKQGQKLVVGGSSTPALTVVTTGVLTETLPTPFRTRQSPRPLMWAGKRIRARKGIPGQERVTYRVTFENGEAVRRDVQEREVLRPAQDQVIAVGTKPRGT